MKKTDKINHAIYQFEKLLEQYPNDIHVVRNLAFAYNKNNEYDKLIPTLHNMAKIQPDNPEAYYYLTSTYCKLNKKIDAKECFKMMVDKGYTDWKRIKNDEAFKCIQDTDYFKHLKRMNE